MRIKFGDVSETLGIQHSYDIINAIRNSGSESFKQYVPLATAENVAEVGAGILVNQAVQNEFISALIDRIGLTVVKSVSLKNPLKKFKKGELPMGRTIEEIFVDLAEEHMYDPDTAEETVFKRELPDVKSLFHERNRQGYYKRTVQDESLRTAFISWGTFEDFLTRVVNSIYNSAEVDEFKYMKLVLDNYASKGLFRFEKVDDPTMSDVHAKDFVKKLRATAQKMTLPMGSRDFNASGVHTVTDISKLHLIIDADIQSQIDVEVLANAFNLDKTTFMGQVTVIDNFATTGLKAVLVDEDFFMVYDTLHKMETIRNPQGLYWNYYYHVWQVLSASRFGNAVAFVTDAADIPDVTQVIVTPEVASVKAGNSIQYEGIIRQLDNVSREITWSVIGKDGTSVKSGTEISADGLLSTDASQTGRLIIKGTVSFGDSETCVGEAVVTVY